MTMPHAIHPDDERLAAYAAGDREAVSDRALAAHVGGCERCRPMVDELTLLRDALATLPDVPPSRPLRLIPPVPEPVARPAGAREWLRRLAAPAMAAGASLVLIGAVGVTGVVDQLGSKATDNAALEGASNGPFAPGEGGAASSQVPATSTDGEYAGRTDDPGSQAGGDSVAPAPSASEHPFETARDSAEEPWLTLLIAGFGVFGVATILRFSLAPRAG
jgi:anti-sigma factor RsiW